MYQNVFNFVCVFCSRTSDIQAVQKSAAPNSKCPNGYELAADPNFPYLCVGKWFLNPEIRPQFLVFNASSVAAPTLDHLFACEPENPCPDDKRTEVWNHELEGQVAKVAVVDSTVGPIILVNRTTTEVRITSFPYGEFSN